ncbi:MAG: hypothetical protein NW215_10005 [Hyphomicrobiales bacterium]|nr:hypothetical protein [Hyphomicrobiales bacterium]
MEIVILACLIAEPTRCMDQRLPELIDNPARCNLMSMLQVAQWAGEHPGWKIVKWRCERPGYRDL